MRRRGALAALLLAVAGAAGCGDASTGGETAQRTTARLAGATTPSTATSPPRSTTTTEDEAEPGPVVTEPNPKLTLRQAIGQRMVFAYDGPTPPAALKRRIRRGEAAGVILFARNIASASHLRRQMAALQAARSPIDENRPLLVMVDQEGGAVRRLPGSPVRGAGQTRDRYDAGRLGAAAARNLERAGVNVDVAPVLDVARPGSVLEAEGRTYGRDPKLVASRASWFAGALRSAGIHPVYKHFPGFGAATVNTDDAAARIDLPLSTLRAVDLAPYRKQYPDAVMVSTAIYPRVDPRPAAFSRRWVTGELRGRLKGYRSVVTMTDDLQTPAVARYGTPAQLAYFAMRAGVDLPIFAQDYATGERVAKGLEDAVRSGRLSRASLDAGVRRVRDWRLSFTFPGDGP